MAEGRKKLSLFVDESGQDTGSKIFVVSVVVAQTANKTSLERTLITLEQQSRKGDAKWRKAYYPHRKRYVEALAEAELSCQVFYREFAKGAAYRDLTAEAVVGILQLNRRGVQTATVFVDGATLTESQRLKRSLKPSVPMRVYVKTIRREQSSALIRLADAVCGLVRDAREGSEWAEGALRKLQARGKVRTF